MSRQFINEPRILATIQTENGAERKLSSVVCLKEDELWTCYTYHNTMIRYNLRGRRQAEEKTRKEQNPYDIAVLQGKLVYTDSKSRCIDIIELGALESNGRRIFTKISLEGWIPQGVCSTRSGGLLVIMKSKMIMIHEQK